MIVKRTTYAAVVAGASAVSAAVLPNYRHTTMLRRACRKSTLVRCGLTCGTACALSVASRCFTRRTLATLPGAPRLPPAPSVERHSYVEPPAPRLSP